MSMQISPQPTEEEAVALAAALEMAFRSSGVASTGQQIDRPNWRFSGRWWARPTIARRQRPWT